MLSSRTVSGFPLSIGTGIAFESIFNTTQPVYDPVRKVPPKANIKNYDQLWINIATLYRNMAGSIKASDAEYVMPNQYAEHLSMEIEVIKSLCANEGMGLITPVFYFCTYDHIYRHPGHKAVAMRMETTDKAKAYKTKLMQTVKLLNADGLVLMLDSELTPTKRSKALVLTNFVWDMLSVNHFTVLDLLESHTGAVKSTAKLNTKYHKYKDLSMLPFNRMLLKVFGDSELFVPMFTAVRDMVLNAATKGKWTPFTTLAKVNMDLDMYSQDKLAVSIIKSL